MIRNKQSIGQRLQQGMQQKLSPQQLQYIKLLQLNTIALEQRIKEEMELNPILEEGDTLQAEEIFDTELNSTEKEEHGDELQSLDEYEVDWEEFNDNTEYDGETYVAPSNPDIEEWRDLPNKYEVTLLEKLEEQVSLLDLNDEEELIADQILGSIDEDGYFRRELIAVADNITFNHGVFIEEEDVENVRKKIQLLEPIGIASKDLQDCLLIQLQHSNHEMSGRHLAIRIVRDAWSAFEKKHFNKLIQKFNSDEDSLKEAFELIRKMDPRPGAVSDGLDDTQNYIEPDFEVYWRGADQTTSGKGEYVITLNQRNAPQLRISPEYTQMWNEIKEKKSKPDVQTQQFMRSKIDSASWFIESIRQRQNTLMNVMKTIVALQEDFFKFGDGLKPMILKDVAERIGMDISTISRVVNGKYVQTNFGVYELKYFFNEGLTTESGEEVSNREVKNILQVIINEEDKRNPHSDQALAALLNDKGFNIARRTVSKYREQLNEPVARLRKQII